MQTESQPGRPKLRIPRQHCEIWIQERERERERESTFLLGFLLVRGESEDGETDGESQQPGGSGEGYEFELLTVRSLRFLVVSFIVF